MKGERRQPRKPSDLPTSRRRVVNGVFCVECTWSGRLNESSSVRPMLELLRGGEDRIRFIHRHADTREALDDYLRRWTQAQYDPYPILYLALHGEASELLVGDHRLARSRVTLNDLGAALAGRCKGRVVHIGSCEGLSTHGKRLRSFARRVGAVGVCGYRSNVEWIESAAFEVLVFSAMQGRKPDGRSFPAMMREVLERYGGLCRRVGFRWFLP